MPSASFSLEPTLVRGGVQVWCADLEVSTTLRQTLEQHLAPDELERARRFVFERDRDRFIAARGMLRAILGHCLGTPPAALRFDYGPYGKPVLHTAGDPHPLRFNVSHSDGMALFGVAYDRDLGVDIERMRADVDTDELSAYCFSATERAAFLRVSAAHKQAAFYAGWTRKEAYIKARGLGLSLRLDSFSVSLGPHEPAALLSALDDDVRRWSLYDLALVDGFRSALIVEQPQAP